MKLDRDKALVDMACVGLTASPLVRAALTAHLVEGEPPLRQPMLAALRSQLTPEAQEWLIHRREEGDLLERFVRRMAEELAANSHKGDRHGWKSAGAKVMVTEVTYHTAKLMYALRQYEQGDGDWEDVLEFAADTANCSLMVADCAGVLGV